MTKIVDLKSTFESFFRDFTGQTILTATGGKRIHGYSIRVYPCRSFSTIALEAVCEGGNITLARSYPMSPRNAYRLVVSL